MLSNQDFIEKETARKIIPLTNFTQTLISRNRYLMNVESPKKAILFIDRDEKEKTALTGLSEIYKNLT